MPMVYLVLLTMLQLGSVHTASNRKCEAIKHGSFCASVNYTHTSIPNLVGLNSQDESIDRLNDYHHLITAKCSEYLSLFLCTVYFPICTPEMSPDTLMSSLKPCQSFCHHVQSLCEPLIKKFNLPWPADLKCLKFDETAICIKPESYEKDKINPKSTSSLSDGKGNHQLMPADDLIKRIKIENRIILPPKDERQCNSAQRKIPKSGFDSRKTNCVYQCQSTLFATVKQRDLMELWLLALVILSLASSFLALLAFLMNPRRFNYPIRPLVMISICFLFKSFGLLIRVIYGFEGSACRHGTILSNETSPFSFLIIRGFETSTCSLIFLITNYMEMAGNFWWIALGISWYLSTSKKWAPESIRRISGFFHAIAWLLPSILTLFFLIRNEIEPNELTGICGLSTANESLLIIRMVYVIINDLILMIISLTFVLAGMSGIFSVRQALQQLPPSGAFNNPPTKVHLKGLERFTLKMIILTGIFFLVKLSKAILLILDINRHDRLDDEVYELSVYDSNQCLQLSGLRDDLTCSSILANRPHFEWALIRLLVNQIIGIISSLLLACNSKTKQDLLRHLPSANRSQQKYAKAHVAQNNNNDYTTDQLPVNEQGIEFENNNLFVSPIQSTTMQNFPLISSRSDPSSTDANMMMNDSFTVCDQTQASMQTRLHQYINHI